jgi:large subunit ribosomal protein L13e
MVKHNNVVPNQHFHKKWAGGITGAARGPLQVVTWFDQAAKKKTRRLKRAAKRSAAAPRPSGGLLRPAVHCPTIKYNSKVRLGRGFSLEELKGAGINAKLAPTIGIAVDKKRFNKSAESLQVSPPHAPLSLRLPGSLFCHDPCSPPFLLAYFIVSTSLHPRPF